MGKKKSLRDISKDTTIRPLYRDTLESIFPRYEEQTSLFGLLVANSFVRRLDLISHFLEYLNRAVLSESMKIKQNDQGIVYVHLE